MRKLVIKLYANFEKEEKWINEMAAKGWNLVRYTFLTYHFEKGIPGEYIYKIELLENMPKHPESMGYIKFMEDAGVECVDTYVRWVFFRRKSSEGAFDLFSDYESRIKHYKRVAVLYGAVILANVGPAISNLLNGFAAGPHSTRRYILYLSILNWLIVIGVGPIAISYIRRINKLKKEKQIYE